MKKGQILSNYEVVYSRMPSKIDRTIGQIMRKRKMKKFDNDIHCSYDTVHSIFYGVENEFFEEIGECNFKRTKFFNEIYRKIKEEKSYKRNMCEGCGKELPFGYQHYFCKKCMKADISYGLGEISKIRMQKGEEEALKVAKDEMRNYVIGIRKLIMSKSEEKLFRKIKGPSYLWDLL